MRIPIGVTRSSSRAASRPGAGSPSGAILQDPRPHDRQEEQGEEDRVLVGAAAPPLRVEHVQQLPEEVAGAVRVLGIGFAKHLGELREERVEQPDLAQEKKGRQRVASLERLRQLLGDAGRCGLDDLLAVGKDRLVGVRRDREAQRLANSTARIIRTGSSRKRMSGSPIVRTRPASRSSRPPT
jgi:hypothetical protein